MKTKKVKDVLRTIRRIRIPQIGVPVEKTVAKEMLSKIDPNAVLQPVDIPEIKSTPGVVYVAVVTEKIAIRLKEINVSVPDKNSICFQIDSQDCVWLLSSDPQYLYLAFTVFQEDLFHLNNFGGIWKKRIGFEAEKSTFDLFLTQYARLLEKFDRRNYIKEYARLGFTHIEVNALATPFPVEEGVPGEFYPDFYTYCPALDQFVSSRLNKGIYPKEYLKANLERLKKNARFAVEYGLIPGLLCFEPRSVPESFFEKYPTLRGARVDHPFRSFKPRYNLSVVHPVVKKHYAELIIRLMEEVPQLGFLTIWTNDSGAGFEHTRSLYVGRNGGAYLIREWKDDEQIAKSAAENVIGFFRLLQESATSVNSDFRVITRLESFYGEFPYLWPQLKNGIDVEANSLLTRGWENNYPHPRFKDIKVLGSAFHNSLWEKEKTAADELNSRKSRSYFYHAFSSHTNHEPLLGIPFPWLTHDKLKAAYTLGISSLAHIGGIQPPDKVPYAVNQEIFRLFQIEPELDIDQMVLNVAQKYVGKESAKDLVAGWHEVEKAIRNFMPLSIYSHYGVVWQRLFVRPLVPDINKIPESDRVYYEKYMCTSIHNPNRVDLSQDVLFELISPEYALKAYMRIDEYVWSPLEKALDLFERKKKEMRLSGNKSAFTVFQDQFYRIKALKCLYKTLRNTAVWIYTVHSYLNTDDPKEKKQSRSMLMQMIDEEITNCKELKQIWEQAPIDWMIISGSEETPFIYGNNFGFLLENKLKLMETYKNDDPFIDPEYMFRVIDNPYEKTR